VDVPFPVGSTVTVTEDLSGFPHVSGSGTQTATVGNGVNEIDFTNSAQGAFELCKDMDASSQAYNGTPFTFTWVSTTDPSISGSQTVNAGACGLPFAVPVGTYRVTETLPLGFQFLSATALGPLSDDRSVGGSGNPFTFTVPYLDAASPNGGITEVDFVNKGQLGVVKACKVIDPHSQAAIGGLKYKFKLSGGALASAITQTVSGPYADAPGSDPSQAGGSVCTVFFGLPLIDPGTGLPYQYTLMEVQDNQVPVRYVTTNIAVTGSVHVTSNNNNQNGRAVFTFTGPGTAAFIVTNASPTQ
jgi:hypothetical protein